jgi:RNA polymerase sigma factor (sigma-70 family)
VEDFIDEKRTNGTFYLFSGDELLTCEPELRIMSKVQTQDEVGLLRELRTDPERTLAVIYAQCKQVFMGYVRKFGGGQEDHLEVYHDAVLAFYDIWLEGRYDASRASISTLLCAIGKNKLLTRLGKQQKHVEWSELTPLIDTADEDTPAPEEDLITRVEKVIETLGDGCKEIIMLFYYQRCSVRDIVERLQYKNENVVKAHKSRCMKRLKDLVQSSHS